MAVKREAIKRRELVNLLNRAAAALETPLDLTEADKHALTQDLVLAAALIERYTVVSLDDQEAELLKLLLSLDLAGPIGLDSKGQKTARSILNKLRPQAGALF